GGGVGRACERQRFVSRDRDERVERRVEPCDPVERKRDELGRRHLSAANEPRLLDRGQERQLHRGEPTSAALGDLIGTLAAMGLPTGGPGVASEWIDLLDWKRNIFDLYRDVRATPDAV